MSEQPHRLEPPEPPEPTSGRPAGPDRPAADPTSLRTQLVRFTLSGGLAALVDFGVLSALMALGMDATWAKACSWVAGTLTAYAINRRWTFQAESSGKRFAVTMGLYAVTFAAQVGIFAALFPAAVDWLGDELAGRVLAFVVAQGVATTINFIVQRMVIFRSVD